MWLRILTLVVFGCSLFACGTTAEAQTNSCQTTDDITKHNDKHVFSVVEQADRLKISLREQPLTEFVFADPKILRPYFAGLRTPGGLQVTRNHPPVEGADATDHDTMHPGLWLAFGDLNGHDFWRNKARIEHLRFSQAPQSLGEQLTFATESRLLTPSGEELGRMNCRFQLRFRKVCWLLDWEAVFHSENRELVFGDQEEMGFAARVATPLTEKIGGLITNSNGLRTAARTWGQPARWCDYSGKIEGIPAGMTIIPDPDLFRECWWHNRDYGVFVANPFGRAALNQGPPSAVTIPRGKPFRLQFTAVIHEGSDYDPEAFHRDLVKAK